MSKKLKNRTNLYFWVQHAPGRSPGQRFRIEQIMPYLEESGYKLHYSNLLNKKEGEKLYQPGGILSKFFILFKSFFIRCRDVIKLKKGEILFIYRESFWLGTNFFERLVKWRGAKIIFDFDDAIWIGDTSAANRKFAFLKRPAKIKTTLRLCDLVIAGNAFLADYAGQFSQKVVIIPTVVDTELYQKRETETSGHTICIGWTGSETTVKHWKLLIPVYLKLAEKYGERIRFKVISSQEVEQAALLLTSIIWNKEDEVDQLQDIDIGIMPLPNDEWDKGKCGFKGIQYMALGIPAVMSPVGVNTEIIEDGVNGFLAGTEEEWIKKLSLLIEDASLRQRLGRAGRQTVVEQYSVVSQKERYLEIFKSL